jgi:opacity protein-like surface antigen
VTTDVDVSFSDILENLDIGGMGFVEHGRGKWSFIVDAVYLKVSDEKTISRTPITSTTLDAEFEQTLLEGFVGYRVFTHNKEKTQFGIDLLGGARYNRIEAELNVQASILGLTTSASRNPDEDWVDGVAALRVQYGHDNGWGVSAWADIGEGSDSSSYQFFGTVNYRFNNNIKVCFGYRLYHFDYTGDSGGRRLDLDLDYTGPMLGIAYRF